MATLEKIIQNYGMIKDAGITHRRHFFNIKESTHDNWYSRRKHGY